MNKNIDWIMLTAIMQSIVLILNNDAGYPLSIGVQRISGHVPALSKFSSITKPTTKGCLGETTPSLYSNFPKTF